MSEPGQPVESAEEMSTANEGSAVVEPGGGKKRRSLAKWVALAIGALVLAGVLLPGFSVTQAGYYGRYPALKKRMHYWSVSTHSRMSCVACHIEPGVGAFVAFAAKSIPAFYSQIVEGPSTTNLLTAPSRKACNKCHTKYREVAPSGDLLIPHRAHVEVLNLDCQACHKDLVHSLNRRGFNRPEMEGCLEECHDGVKASDKCSSCHTQKAVPKSHKAKTWLEVHGQESESQDCGKCHDWTPNYCGACHKRRPSTHVGNWKKDHSVRAKERGDGCLVCHDKVKFCGECH